MKFLENAWSALAPGLVRESAALKALNGGNQVKPWDVPYLVR